MARDKNKGPVRGIGKKMGKNEAKKWVRRWKKEHGDTATRGWLYGDEIIKEMLSYEGCEGIWFFKGIADDNSERLVMFPADEDGNILDRGIRSLGAAARDDFDSPADGGSSCPPDCPDGLDDQ